MTGFLAVWNDFPVEHADAYERWYVTDHLPDRVSLPGFLTGRRYARISGDREYFTAYEVAAPEVLTSPRYKARLAEPTPGTQAMMALWQGMIRGTGTVETAHGDVFGSAVLVWRLRRFEPGVIDDCARLDALLLTAGICRIRLWCGQRSEGTPTVEARIRQERDRDVAGALLVEVLRESDLAEAERSLRDTAVGRYLSDADLGTFRLLCGLDHATARVPDAVARL